MIELHTAATPNGWKVSIMLEECELPYSLHAVNLGRGEQREPAFLELSPNGRIPAIRDGELTLFESGAILHYLAEKTGRFLPDDDSGRWILLRAAPEAKWQAVQAADEEARRIRKRAGVYELQVVEPR